MFGTQILTLAIGSNKKNSSSGGSGVLYRSLVQNKTPSCKAVTVKPWVMLDTHTQIPTIIVHPHTKAMVYGACMLPSCSKKQAPLFKGDFRYSCSDFSTCVKLAIFPASTPHTEGRACGWLCGGGHDGSHESVGLLTQQRGMFSFGYKAFLRDLRRGCGQNNASLGYAKLEWVDFYEGHRRSWLSSSLDRWLACQSHLRLQHGRSVWIQCWWAAKHAVGLCQQQGSGQR